MNNRGLVIVAVLAIAILLVGSTAFSHSAEAKSKSGKIKVGFGDARGFQGKGAIKIWNLDNGKTLVKGKINFAKLDAEGCFCKTFSFKWKGNQIGDRIAFSVGEGSSTTGWSDTSGDWKLKKGTTRVTITLDEIGE